MTSLHIWFLFNTHTHTDLQTHTTHKDTQTHTTHTHTHTDTQTHTAHTDTKTDLPPILLQPQWGQTEQLPLSWGDSF